MSTEKQRANHRRWQAAYRAKQRPEVIERHRLEAKRDRQRHPAQAIARRRVYRAVKSGRLVRLPCWCGEAKVQAHHANGYESPHELDVVWLCIPHHYEVHRAAA